MIEERRKALASIFGISLTAKSVRKVIEVEQRKGLTLDLKATKLSKGIWTIVVLDSDGKSREIRVSAKNENIAAAILGVLNK